MCKTMVDAGWGRMVAGEALHRISIVLSWLSLINNDDEPPKDGNDNCQQSWYDHFPAMVRMLLRLPHLNYIIIVSWKGNGCYSEEGKMVADNPSKLCQLVWIHQSCANWFGKLRRCNCHISFWIQQPLKVSFVLWQKITIKFFVNPDDFWIILDIYRCTFIPHTTQSHSIQSNPPTYTFILHPSIKLCWMVY